MKLRIELKAAMLITLLMLLWLALEFMVGLQDQFIAYHPYITMIALFIPVIVTRLALITKRDEELHGNITFAQAFKSGAVIAVLSAALSIPTQYIFHYLINPDFFDTMIKYAVAYKKSSPEQAANYFNFQSYLLQSVIGTLIVGFFIALVASYMLRTKPAK